MPSSPYDAPSSPIALKTTGSHAPHDLPHFYVAGPSLPIAIQTLRRAERGERGAVGLRGWIRQAFWRGKGRTMMWRDISGINENRVPRLSRPEGDRSMRNSSGGGRMAGASGWPSMIQCVSETSTKATGFSEDLFSCKLIEGKNQFLMLKRCEESHVILVINHNNGQRGP